MPDRRLAWWHEGRAGRRRFTSSSDILTPQLLVHASSPLHPAYGFSISTQTRPATPDRPFHPTPATPSSDKTTLVIDPFADSKRLHRPLSPSLAIYRPWLTWTLSIGHRFTGIGTGLCEHARHLMFPMY